MNSQLSTQLSKSDVAIRIAFDRWAAAAQRKAKSLSASASALVALMRELSEAEENRDPMNAYVGFDPGVDIISFGRRADVIAQRAGFDKVDRLVDELEARTSGRWVCVQGLMHLCDAADEAYAQSFKAAHRNALRCEEAV
jgi:hypothetical protein